MPWPSHIPANTRLVPSAYRQTAYKLKLGRRMQVFWISEIRALHRARRKGPSQASLRAIRTRTLMRRQLPNKHCEPPNELNTFRTSERKLKESADFGCQDTAHTRPSRSIVASHPSLDLANSHRLPLIITKERYRHTDVVICSLCLDCRMRHLSIIPITLWPHQWTVRFYVYVNIHY